MTVQKIIEIISKAINNYWWIVPILMSILEVSKIKVNPWRWTFKQIQKALGITKLFEMHKELRDDLEERSAINNRTRILRFGDEIKNGVRHSEQYFEQILADIDKYEKYCEEHPNFKNGKTRANIEIINEIYKKCQLENDFL